MIIIAVDPGLTTGYAAVNGVGRVLEHGQVPDDPGGLLELRAVLVRSASVPAETKVVVEDYLGGGPRDRQSLRTLSVMGCVRGWCLDVLGREPVWHPPQARKGFVEQAREILGDKRAYRHAVDALAHALARLWSDRG